MGETLWGRKRTDILTFWVIAEPSILPKTEIVKTCYVSSTDFVVRINMFCCVLFKKQSLIIRYDYKINLCMIITFGETLWGRKRVDILAFWILNIAQNRDCHNLLCRINRFCSIVPKMINKYFSINQFVLRSNFYKINPCKFENKHSIGK